MATPCSHDPNEVIQKIVSAKANADKFDRFVNGTDTQTVQLGSGSPTPTIRNAVRQIMADASWAKQFIANAPEGDISLNNAATMNTSVSRTLAERFADVINVKDYGAKGDGSTDDRAAIQAALAAAHNDAAPRLVVFPAGTYLISDRLECGANTTIHGLGEAVIKKATGLPSKGILCNSLGLTANGSLTGYNGNSNITIENMIFEGEFYNETEPVHAEYGIGFAHCKNVAVRNCEFRYWNHCHLTEFSGVMNGLVENCHYHKFKYDAVSVENSTYHMNEIIQLDPCNIYSSPMPDISSGDFTPNKDIRIVDTIIGDDSGDECGIGIGSYTIGVDSYTDGISIENCTIKSGIRGLTLINCRNVKIKGNNIDASKVGLLIYNNGAVADDIRYIVEGNTIRSEERVVDYQYAPTAGDRRNSHTYTNNILVGGYNQISYVQDVIHLVFSSNYISGNVFKFNGVSGAEINGNVFAGCKYEADPAGATVTIGKSVNNNPSNVTVSSNKISNVYTTKGIRCNHVERINIVGNTIWNLNLGDIDEPTCPIVLSDSTSAFAAENTAYGAGDFGYLVYCDSTSVMTDGGNWCSAGFASNLNAIDNNKLMQINGIQFSNVFSKDQHFDIVYPVDITNQRGALDIATKDENGTIKRVAFFSRHGALLPAVDNDISCGWGDNRWTAVYAASGTINTSDMREKTSLADPSDALMRAWGRVGFKVFQFIDAVDKKGAEEARLHVGVIAQDVQAAFAEEGLDAGRYGLFCYDEWDDEFEEVEVEDSPEVVDAEGIVTQKAQTHVERRQTKTAGDRYGIRYEEALALECAYQRWRLQQIEARLNEVSGNSPAHSDTE